jgi:myo-inositol-1(or 4)-monophosphatase
LTGIAAPTTLDGFLPEAGVALRAVELGLAVARGRVGADELRLKGGRDLVTATDISVERAVRSVLTEAIDLPVVGEELGGAAEAGRPHWLVDPICGTRNYASGIPLFAVNVALVDGGAVVLGAVGDGSTGELLLAERGRGAFSIGAGRRRRLVVSEESRTVTIEGWPPAGAARSRAARAVAAAIAADRWDVRSLGTSLSLAYLAAGRLAGCVLFAAPALHVAAGILLAAEAGATISDGAGLPWTPESDSLVAAAGGELHQELLDTASLR